MSKSIAQEFRKQIHATRLKAIRKFVNFDYNLREPLSEYAKRKIKTYYDAIYGGNGLARTHHQIYRPRTSKHLKAAKQYVGGKNALPGLKVAFLPAGPESKKARVRFLKSGELEMQTEFVTRITVKIDNEAFAKNPYIYAQNIVDSHHAYKYFTLVMKNYELTTSWPRSRFAEAMREYSMAGASGKGVIENYAEEIAMYKFRNQKDYEEYRREQRTAQKEKYDENRREKRRAKKKAGKEKETYMADQKEKRRKKILKKRLRDLGKKS